MAATFPEVALSCVRRGWYVFPCWPKTKEPMTDHGHKDASNDEAQVRTWWSKTPNANVAIATGPSNLAVFDADHGFTDKAGFQAWRERNGLPTSYTVRTGRRDDYGVQTYYSGIRNSTLHWEHDGASGDVKSAGGYVMAAGCIHPDSGEAYEVLTDAPLAPMPDLVRTIQGRKLERVVDGEGFISEWRNDAMIRILGKMREAGLTDDLIRDYAIRTNEQRMRPPLDEEELERLISNACKFPLPAPEPKAIIGSKPEERKVTDWRELFHSKEEALNAPPITFLIDSFLQREGVTAIAGPVRERKSLIALNVAHALLTGEKLFDHFEVRKRPERVLYLCPEVSLGPFTDRLKKIGLLDYVGESLFYRTLSADGHLTLNAPELQPALPGSVVILDTAIRFLEGDENSSQDVRAFADGIFALLQRRGGISGHAASFTQGQRGCDDPGECDARQWRHGRVSCVLLGDEVAGHQQAV